MEEEEQDQGGGDLKAEPLSLSFYLIGSNLS